MANDSKQYTFTTEQLQKLQQLGATREGKTITELMAQVVDRGLYDLAYRTKRNKEQWSQFKEWKKNREEN
jgi:hypothetical protein